MEIGFIVREMSGVVGNEGVLDVDNGNAGESVHDDGLSFREAGDRETFFTAKRLSRKCDMVKMSLYCA